PYLAWAVAAWALIVVIVLVVAVPGWSAGVRALRVGESEAIGIFDAPLPLRALLVAAGAVLAGMFTIVRELRRRVRGNSRRVDVLVREVWLAVSASPPPPSSCSRTGPGCSPPRRPDSPRSPRSSRTAGSASARRDT